MNVSLRKKLFVLVSFFLVLSFCSTAQADRSIQVKVTNFPDTVATIDVDHPANQPFQFNDYRINYVDHPNTNLSTGIAIENPVPEEKKLVIQHVSVQVSGPKILKQPKVFARVASGGSYIAKHPLPLVMSNYRDEKVLTASLPITLYVENGQDLGVYVQVATDDDYVRTDVAFTGYFVDAD